MDEIRNAISRVYNAFVAWAEFGMLSLALMIVIPYALAIGVLLLLLPFILFFVGVGSPWPVAIYIFAIMAFVGVYCYRNYVSGGDPDAPISGRPIISQDRANRRSRSIMRNSKRRRR
jgi:hypothetical protein